MKAHKLYTLLIVFGLLALNLLIRLWFAASNDIAHDEPFSLFFAQGSPAQIIENLKPYNNPPLYELILHYWIKLFGIDPFAVRSLSCIFSSLAAIILFLLVKRRLDIHLSISITLIFTFSTFAISFAHETRAYSLFVLLTLFSIYFFDCLLENKQKMKNIMGYSITTILLLYTHFFSIWVICIQGLYFILFKRGKNKFVWIGFIISFLGFIPYLKVIIERFSKSAGEGTWLDKPTFSALYENIRHFSNKPVIAIIFLLVIFIGLILYLKNRQNYKEQKIEFYLLWFFVPYFLMFIISFKIPMFLGRYLIFLLPSFFILVILFGNIILERITQTKYWIYIFPLLMMTTVKLNPSNDLKPSQVAHLVKPFYERKVPIILSPMANDIIIAYHLDKELFVYRDDYRNNEISLGYIPSDNVKEIELKDETIFIETPKHYLDKERKNLEFLKSKYELVQELKVDNEFPKGYEVYYFKGLRQMN